MQVELAKLELDILNDYPRTMNDALVMNLLILQEQSQTALNSAEFSCKTGEEPNFLELLTERLREKFARVREKLG